MDYCPYFDEIYISYIFYKIFLHNDFVFYVFVKVVLAFQYHIGHRTILNPSLKLLNLFLFDIEV